jgi:hypothetical protein
LKKLVLTDPQALVTWLMPDGTFIGERPHELKHWTLEVDALLGVMVSEQEMLLHHEFQTYNDPGMAERLLRYNVLARSEHKLPCDLPAQGWRSIFITAQLETAEWAGNA